MVLHVPYFTCGQALSRYNHFVIITVYIIIYTDIFWTFSSSWIYDWYLPSRYTVLNSFFIWFGDTFLLSRLCMALSVRLPVCSQINYKLRLCTDIHSFQWVNANDYTDPLGVSLVPLRGSHGFQLNLSTTVAWISIKFGFPQEGV